MGDWDWDWGSVLSKGFYRKKIIRQTGETGERKIKKSEEKINKRMKVRPNFLIYFSLIIIITAHKKLWLDRMK